MDMRLLLVFCLGCLPFILPFRAYPDPLIVSTQSAFSLLAMLLCLTAFFKNGFRFGKLALVLLFVGIVLVVHGALFASYGVVQGTLAGVSLILAALVVAMFNGLNAKERALGIKVFALGLVVGGCFNMLSGWTQFLGLDLGPLFIRKDELSIGGVYGNIGQRNVYASYLFITYFAFIFLVRGRAYAISLGVGYGVLVGVTAALTGSRAAILYALVAFMLPFMIKTPSRGTWLWGGVSVLLSQLMAQGALYLWGDLLVGVERLAGGYGIRLDEYAKALLLFKENMLFGVGLQNYALSSFELSVREGLSSVSGEAWTHPHNIFLILLAGCGLIGLVVCVLIIWLCVRALRIKSKDDVWAFGVGALVCIFIHSQLEYPLWLFSYFVVFSVLLGIVFVEDGWELRLLGRGLVAALMVGGLLMSAHSIYGYFVLVENYSAVDGADKNRARIQNVYAVSVNPLIAQAADLVILNYLVPSRDNWQGGYCLFERLARVVPSYTLLDQMAFYAWYAGETGLAQRIWRARGIYYPKKDWQTLQGLFEQYYPERKARWADFVTLEQAGFNDVKPFSFAEPGICAVKN